MSHHTTESKIVVRLNVVVFERSHIIYDVHYLPHAFLLYHIRTFQFLFCLNRLLIDIATGEDVNEIIECFSQCELLLVCDA